MGFLLTDWRSGCLGAFQMGLKPGQYCIGCCWGLMMVLFVGGVLLIVWGMWLMFGADGNHPRSM